MRIGVGLGLTSVAATGGSRWSPLSLFENGAYSGRLYDLRPGKSKRYVDDGVTIATVGDGVQRIEDLTGAADATQSSSAFRGVLQADGSILTDGLDDFYTTALNASTSMTMLLYVDSPASSFGIMIGVRASNPASVRIEMITNGTIAVRLGSTNNISIPTGDVRGVNRLISFSFDPTLNSDFWLDDELVLNFSPPNRNPSNNYPIYFGALNNAGTPTTHIQMKVYGVLLINRQLTDEEVANAYAYWSA